MAKSANEFIRFVKSKVGTPYVYGAKGMDGKLTLERLDMLKKANPGIFTTSYYARAKRYVGRVCTDCSGLISWYTGILRGSAGYYSTALVKKPISQLDETMIGWAVYKKGHIGIYIGGGYCIEAKGINYGTVKTKVSSTRWTHVLKLKDIRYPSVPASAASAPAKKPQSGKRSPYEQFVGDVQKACGAKVDYQAGPETLRKTVTVSKTRNRRHPVVRPLQTYLNKLGYSCGRADGIAGSKFDAAVKSFQLKVVGMKNPDGEFTAGKNSWKKILRIR